MGGRDAPSRGRLSVVGATLREAERAAKLGRRNESADDLGGRRRRALLGETLGQEGSAALPQGCCLPVFRSDSENRLAARRARGWPGGGVRLHDSTDVPAT